MLAFRPVAVIDDSLGPEDLQLAAPPTEPSAVVEVGTQVKKSREAQQPAVAPIESRQVEPRPVEPKPVEPRQIAPAPVTPAGAIALADLNPANWSQLLESLGLVGIVYNIASHCELRSNDDGSLEFALDTANASLFNDGHSDKIRMALENYFGQSLAICIVPGEVQGETPAMCKARLMRERQQEAIASIEGDPQLQALIARFDGELDRSSIVPTDI
jgi:DNA polymerase-3 subunit gamma/tau